MKNDFSIVMISFLLGAFLGFNLGVSSEVFAESGEGIKKDAASEEIHRGKELPPEFTLESGEKKSKPSSEEPKEELLLEEKEVEELKEGMAQEQLLLPEEAREKVFQEMDYIDLEIARQQRELMLVELEIQKLELLLKQKELQNKLGGISAPAVSTAAAVDQAGALQAPGQMNVLSIMAFGQEKMAYLRIGARTEEVKEGDVIVGLGQEPLKIIKIDPRTDSVVIKEKEHEKRYYAIGAEEGAEKQ